MKLCGFLTAKQGAEQTSVSGFGPFMLGNGKTGKPWGTRLDGPQIQIGRRDKQKISAPDRNRIRSFSSQISKYL